MILYDIFQNVDILNVSNQHNSILNCFVNKDYSLDLTHTTQDLYTNRIGFIHNYYIGIFKEQSITGFLEVLQASLIFIALIIFIWKDTVLSARPLVNVLRHFNKVIFNNNKTLKDESFLLFVLVWSIWEQIFNINLNGFYTKYVKSIKNIILPAVLLFWSYVGLCLLIGLLLPFIVLGYSNSKDFLQKFYSDFITLLSFFLRIVIQYVRFVIILVFFIKFYFSMFELFFKINNDFTLLDQMGSLKPLLYLVKLLFDLLELSFVIVFQLAVYFILFNIVFKSFLLTWGSLKKGV